MNKNVTALILIVIALGTYFTVTKSVIDDAKAIKDTNDQYATAIKKSDQLIKDRDEVMRRYNSISQEDRDRLDKIIPSGVDNIRLMIDMNALAVKDGVALKSITASAISTDVNADSSQNTNTGPALSKIKLSMGVSASYKQIIGFLKDIESNLRIMDVSKMSVSGGENGVYNLGLDVITYWLKQ